MSRLTAALAVAGAVAGLALAAAPAQAAPQTQINQCAWLGIPAGWIDTGHLYTVPCGNSLGPNTMILVQGSSVPVGTQLHMCATTMYQPPAGWNIVSGLFNQSTCATSSVPTLDKNAYIVQRFA